MHYTQVHLTTDYVIRQQCYSLCHWENCSQNQCVTYIKSPAWGITESESMTGGPQSHPSPETGLHWAPMALTYLYGIYILLSLKWLMRRGRRSWNVTASFSWPTVTFHEFSSWTHLEEAVTQSKQIASVPLVFYHYLRANTSALYGAGRSIKFLGSVYGLCFYCFFKAQISHHKVIGN